MKKSLIILTVFLLVLAIFTGCGNKKIKGTDNVTMAGEGEIPALTEKGGELSRDDDGRMRSRYLSWTYASHILP